MISKLVWQANYLPQDDNLGLEAQAFRLKGVTTKVEVEVIEQTICKTMNVVLSYGKRLAFVKNH